MLKTVNIVALGVAALLIGASAGAVSLSPVKLEILLNQRATALSITNDTSESHTYDVRISSWKGTGKNGALLESSEAVITSKPVVTIPAFSTATIRVAVVTRSSLPSDYYRVIVQDITPDAKNSKSADMNVSFSLPLQITNKFGAKGSLTPAVGGFMNVGDAAVNITGTTRYVLPGETWLTKDALQSFTWSSGIQ